MEQDLATMIKSMKEYFDEELDDKRQEYEVALEDLKVLHPLDITPANLARIRRWVNDFQPSHHDLVANFVS